MRLPRTEEASTEVESIDQLLAKASRATKMGSTTVASALYTAIESAYPEGAAGPEAAGGPLTGIVEGGATTGAVAWTTRHRAAQLVSMKPSPIRGTARHLRLMEPTRIPRTLL